MVYREFYKELGNLLYAVAQVDGKINRKETEELKELVKNKLSAYEGTLDEFGTDLAFLTEFEFDFDSDRFESADEAYESFITFVRANSERVKAPLRRLAFDLAKKIAESYRGKNKSETALIRRLRKDLEIKMLHSEKKA